MSRTTSTNISLRKAPKQARSTDLVNSVLQAAVQVLAARGAQQFTMARVADRAGVSVGSLYQYFPNKAAILFRLQADEWRDTTAMLIRILESPQQAPQDRLRLLVQAFIRSECDEADVRGALNDAAPLYRDAPEAKEARSAGERALRKFMREAMPDAADSSRAMSARLIAMTLSGAGKQFSETPRTPREAEQFATALGDMLCAYLDASARRIC